MNEALLKADPLENNDLGKADHFDMPRNFREGLEGVQNSSYVFLSEKSLFPMVYVIPTNKVFSCSI